MGDCMKEILLVIPAYNEQDNVLNVLKDIEDNLSNCDYLFVNDCSSDGTGKLLDEHNINHIDLPINLGLAGAVQAGYKYAYYHGYQAAIQFDGDGQHKAIYIHQMKQELDKGYDIVIGSRFVNQKKSMSLRMLGSRIITFLIKLKTGVTIKDPTSGMRLMNRKLIYDYAFNMNRKPEPDTLVYQIAKGAKIKEVQVEMNDRLYGSSIYHSTFNSVKYMINIMISIIFFN